MDGPELSQQERMILDDIEAQLRSDQRLDRRLRTLRRGARPWTGSWSDARSPGLGLYTCLLAVACAAAFVRVLSTASPTVLWVFAALWVPTVICGLRLLCRWGSARLTTMTRHTKP
ncbi:DUF3040 domain-containing protein [Streptomyces sp. NBC_01351]|uniref:hypothetical protein n=1 Tax=Streptomyces sp. NBC_01351 TaxID=2903833 RepID=UPI002E2FAA6F|nr:hypothetical protein [Streptomyces sp. NBC_01351]